MFNSQLPPLSELPSSRQLIGSTLVAAGVAAALLATVVLPSEYGIDPTGVGRILGLTEMGEIKTQLSQEAARDATANAAPTATTASPIAAVQASPATAVTEKNRSDTTTVQLAVGEGAEVKLTAVKGAQIDFDWSVTGGHVNFDSHADAPGIDYHGYGKGKESTGERGTLNSAFDGKHGWFWRNRSDSPVTVTLRTKGAYSEIKRVL